jgi:tetratricopeptide (TPR) repeat protein
MARRLFIILFLGAQIAAAAPNEKEIAALYARGLAGDASAVNQCIAALEEALGARPNDELARVYLGSAYTLQSRDLPIGWKKLAVLRHGIVLMDEAAAKVPENARVQLLRAVTFEAFPSVLGRRKIAQHALDNLVAEIAQHPEKLRPADQQLLYLNAGEAAEKSGDKTRATKLWRRGLTLAGDPKLTAEIHAALAQP